MGQEQVDIEPSIRWCAGDSAPTYFRLVKEQGASKVGIDINGANWDTLVHEAGEGENDFDTEASSILGGWYDDLPDTGNNPGKETAWLVMKRIHDSPE